MLLNILSVGNKLSEWESAGISYYLKQLPKTVDINFINIKGQQHPKKSKNEILKSESEMIVSKIPTENFIDSMKMDTPEREEQLKKMINIPLKRWGKPEDIGAAVVFMASPASGWVTGQCLFVSGGL